MNLIKSVKKSKHENIYLLIIFVLSIYPLMKIGLIINDDFRNSMLAHSNSFSSYMQTTAAAWKFQGRINFLASVFYYVPFIFENFVYFKLITLSILFTNILLVSFFFYKVFNDYKIFYLSFLIILVSFQNSWEHNPITSFPGFFSIPFSFLIISFVMFISFLKIKTKKYLYMTLLCYGLTIFSYENFLIYSPIFLFIAIYFEGFKNYKNIFKRILPIVILCSIYLLIYFVFRSKFGSSYEGAQIGDSVNILNIFKVIWQFSISSVPSYFVFEGKYKYLMYIYNDSVYQPASLNYFIDTFEVQWLVKALLVCILFYSISNLKNPLKIKQCLLMLSIGIIYFFLPNLLLGLTPLYQQAVIQNGQLGMPSSYFSMFAFVLIIITIISLVQNIPNSKIVRKLLIGFLCVIVMFFSLATDSTNKYISKYQTLSTYKWKSVDELLESKTLKSISENAIIYAPSLWEYIGTAALHESYWSEYFSHKLKKNISVIKDINSSINSNEVFYLKYNQSPKELNQNLIFAKIDIEEFKEKGRFLSPIVTIFNFSKYDEYSVIGKTVEDSLNHVESMNINSVEREAIKVQGAFGLNINYGDFSWDGNLKNTIINSDKLIDVNSVTVIYQTKINFLNNIIVKE
ncbi:hypothetical protein [Paenibacillus piscarius]|uniref:hypothetical protein n=1 Tax=Paenibacillus piscarius TaxID=1089681 RepID=UPI001EE999B6|nr:hypothetical protein [Paenibacillus piscarius]